MNPLIKLFLLLWREERAALSRGLLLSVAVLVAGGALLGLSGWFIVAAGAAGIAGIGIAFDVFRPSAGVRFLALGRTAARYGERLLTHDATLRALARLRVRLLDRLSGRDAQILSSLRSSEALNRLTADVDALDGIAIRLAFPIAAGAVTLSLAFAMLAWLVTPLVATLVTAPLALGAAAVLLLTGRAGIAPAARAEAARQAFRSRTIDHLRGRTALAFAGALPVSRAAALRSEVDVRQAERHLARLDRRAEAVASSAGLTAAAGAMAIGGALALAGTITPAVAAIGVFAALALTEVLAPLQRGVAEIGRMRDAAGRVMPLLEQDPRAPSPAQAARQSEPGPALQAHDLTVAPPGSQIALLPPLTFSVAAGETVALTGRSGRGKSTLLAALSGLSRPLSGDILLSGQPIDRHDETELRRKLGYLPQRSALISGTIRENLALAAPAASDDDMTALLEALGLWPVVARDGGLDMRLGEAGSGLSGGETRRLTLARVALRRPDVLLLDEPTEGLEAGMSAWVLAAIRHQLPSAAILIATHRQADIQACDKSLSI
ncbi:ABC transporter, nucleotide binding protein/ATPase protein [Roseibacterium elongatum DSM 19469]|uniref:ABC transporter, nucleotide binding protein/ATPase protein n=1 Tax=Roseicyclus elongatus DSM 19469 TaxID=1294273 RepID=W8RXG7_9RHOB|nr:thiol reductant ABC exporter subunit CydC [Roseibacterium elongatum]AHM02492.1 ABC transporter, nucleotide binding protein/ATPase protein [Roseibacterium elongatum DSM 19469]